MTGRILAKGEYGHTDLRVGDRVETGTRLVTASDVDRFADLSGDRFAIHMDDSAARALGFASRVAHGLLVVSMIDGLKNQSAARLRAVASMGWDIRFRAPVLVGDTLRAVYEVDSSRLAKDGVRGIVVFSVSVLNHRDEIVQLGSTTLLMQP